MAVALPAAVSLASAGLFSNDHSRADLPLAGAGALLVLDFNQRHVSKPPSTTRLAEASPHSPPPSIPLPLQTAMARAAAAALLTPETPCFSTQCPPLGRKRRCPHARPVAKGLLDATTEPLRHVYHVSALLGRHTATAFATNGPL